MKIKIAYTLIFLGCLSFFAQSFYSIKRDKEYLALQLISQRSSVEEGLQTKWKNFLLEKAKQDKLPKTFNLLWNRQGRELRHHFFPLKESYADWKSYRELVKLKEDLKAKIFLEKLLNLNNSWDRILAIEEWKLKYKTFPKIDFSPYELTIVDPEAKAAYRLLFEQFNGVNIVPS